MRKLILAGIAASMVLVSPAALSDWDADKEAEYHEKSQNALAAFLKSDPDAQKFVDNSAGYVVIPVVGKAAIGIGGAHGKGLLYEGSAITAIVSLTQLSFGFQGGGQAYSEFIFFEDDLTLANFKKGNFELNAQASAVAVTAGASADASFEDGMAIFTQEIGGLMYEAAVGGQKFNVELK